MVEKHVRGPEWEGYRGETVKLGDLVIDRRTWVREEFNKDHIRCLVNDLVTWSMGQSFHHLRRTGRRA